MLYILKLMHFNIASTVTDQKTSGRKYTLI